jgi:hypothetical protein
MRLNHQLMVGLKNGSRPYGKMQHGNQMEIWVLTRVPMKGRNYRTRYDVQIKWLMSEPDEIEPKVV